MEMRKERKTERINLLVTFQEKEMLRQLAKERRQSMTQTIMSLIEREIGKKG